MTLKVRIHGYKCYAEAREMELRKFTFLIGPMGSGKSALMEALSQLLYFTSTEAFVEAGGGGEEVVWPEHLRGLPFDELLNKSTDSMEMTIHDVSSDALVTLRYSRRRKTWRLVVSIRGERWESGDASSLSELQPYTAVLRGEAPLRASAWSEEDKKVQELRDLLSRYKPAWSNIGRLCRCKPIYFSAYRPPPALLEWWEESPEEPAVRRALPALISDLVHAVKECVAHRWTKKDCLEKLEFNLRSLGVCPAEGVCLEFGIKYEEGREKYYLTVMEKRLPLLSSGEQTALLIAALSMRLSQGDYVLFVEEPEVGVHAGTLYKMLEILYKAVSEKGEGAYTIVSTHNLLTLNVLRRLVVKKSVRAEDVIINYVLRETVLSTPEIYPITVEENGLLSRVPLKPLPYESEALEYLRSIFELEGS